MGRVLVLIRQRTVTLIPLFSVPHPRPRPVISRRSPGVGDTPQPCPCGDCGTSPHRGQRLSERLARTEGATAIPLPAVGATLAEPRFSFLGGTLRPADRRANTDRLQAISCWR